MNKHLQKSRLDPQLFHVIKMIKEKKIKNKRKEQE